MRWSCLALALFGCATTREHEIAGSIRYMLVSATRA
jgi:hypothetical protein